ncbi:MAG: EAL domain-containing protein [Candidatus Thiodiazotropha sp.]
MKPFADKNIAPLWRLFWLLSIITLALSLALARYFYNNVLENKFRDLDQFNTLVKEGWVESRLYAQESVLKILSERLIEMDGISHPDRAMNLLDSLVKNSANVIGIGLFDAQGELLISTHHSRVSFPNLLQNKTTASTFLQTLDSAHMVLGHVYYNPFFDQWILPLRYAFRTPQGKSYVVTSWYDAEGGNALFHHDNIPGDLACAVISSDFVMLDYKVVYPRNTIFFQTPLPEAVIDQFNLRKLKGNQRILQSYIDRSGQLRYISVTYVPRYGIYISLTRAHSEAIKGFYPIALKIALATLFFWGVMYLFFAYVAKKDQEAQLTLEHQAKHDSVTGLMNRFAISHEIGLCISRGQQFCLAFIDLDNFKTINDLYGHRTGDQVLVQVAKRLLTVMEKDMHCARFSGDEFALLIPHSPERAARIYRHVLELIKLPFDLEYSALHVSASMGVSVFPLDSQSPEELLRYADIALNQAKKQHDHCTFFEQDFHNKVERRSIIQESFNSALKKEEFYLMYQPQVDAKSNTVIGVEALARWKSSELGEIEPVEFIPIAEESGFIIPLGISILEKACRTTQAIWQQSGQDFKLSVNVSVRQLVEESFISQVSQCINKLKFPHDKLVLEVTESIMIEESERIIQKLQLLRDQGIGVSLDDFGTGYSSLSMISRMPISELKVDQSFIRDLLVDENHAHLSEIIIEIGRFFKIDVVAEGVAQQAHVDLLTKFGCHILQGYHFSEPLREKDLEAYIRSKHVRHPVSH